jgi:uncharacterized membrane protein
MPTERIGLNHKRFLPWFLLVCLLDFGLRFSALTFDSLYLDEAYQSMYESTGQPLTAFMKLHGESLLFRFDEPHPLSDVLAHFREVDPLCPPLYGVLLNRWRLIAGSSDLALRGFSVVFSVLANIAEMIFATAIFGPVIGLCTGLLQAISPFDLTYGQEVRMYSLELFLATTSTGCLVWLIQAAKTRARFLACALYAVSTWALVNTHYTAVFTVAYQVLFALVVCWKRRDGRLLLWLIAGWLLFGLLFIPWLNLLLQAQANSKGSYYVTRHFTWWWPVWALLGRIPLNWCGFLSGSRVPAYFAPIYLTSAVVLAFGIKNAVREVRSAPKAESKGSATAAGSLMSHYLILSWAIVPALMLWILDVVETRKVVEVSRYLIATAPAVYMLAGSGMSVLLRRQKWWRFLLVGHVLFALANITYYHIVPQRRPWKLMAEKVEQLVKPDEILMISQYYDIVCLDRYLHRPVRQLGLSPNMGADSARDTIRSFLEMQRFWLITAEDGDSIITMIPPEFHETSLIRLPHDLHLYLYERSSNSVGK